MKNNIKKIGFLIIIFIGTFFVSSYFRGLEGSVSVAEIMTDMRFSKSEHNFSDLKKDVEVSTYFIYENTGDKPLKIKNISSSCGCTIPKWSRKELAVGEKDSILVSYDSKKEGYFAKSVYVISNSVNSPDVLYIKGSVK